MNLTDDKLNQLNNPALTSEQKTLLRCRLAAEFIHTGQYQFAQEALGDLWRGAGVRPNIEGLRGIVAAEVLLFCGVLSGCLGSSNQKSGLQAEAKDLISESISLFEKIGETTKAAIAQSELGVCYWREGAYDEARIILEEAFYRISDDEVEPKAKISLRRVIVESSVGRYNDALRLLTESTRIFETSKNDALKGRFHNELALVFRRLASAEGRADYFDKAIIEYTAAIYHYEQSNHERYKATNQNNLAFLLSKLGRYQEAHEQLDHARKVLLRLNDIGLLAQIDETRAQVLLAEQRYEEALNMINGVVAVLEKGDERKLLTDALKIQATIKARLGNYNSSLSIFRYAINISEDAGALESAGRAALSMIEEHGTTRLSENEIYNIYRRADRLLAHTQDAEDIARLRSCAKIVMRRLLGMKLSDPDFSLSDALLSYEARFIEQALREEKGSVSRAARKLGMTHQNLIYLLRTRHKKLSNQRTPAIRRRLSMARRDR